mmetsp:Transcript_405/g.894  ORF Transcript_405/g.894 Transcript_405/m.894 type:complete len:561 (-) Transcript_405:250-1932(-)
MRIGSAALLLLLAAVAASSSPSSSVLVEASHVVSGTTTRLPQCLSEVITDLEAEGATKIASCAFLTSRSVTSRRRSKLFRSLFGVTGEGDHDDEVDGGTTTAFGKRMGEEHDDGDSDEDGEEGDEGGAAKCGVAVANPPRGATVGAVAATVQACEGNVVLVVSPRDLDRGEGLFENLAPACERLLASRQDEGEGELGSEALKGMTNALIVVIDGARTASDINAAKVKFESATTKMLAGIVVSGSGGPVTLRDVFRDVEYVTSLGPVDAVLAGVEGASSDPATAASAVASAVYDLEGGGAPAGVGATSPLDLAAARKLGPAARKALEDCVGTVKEFSGEGLVTNFGDLCDAAVKKSLELFDADAGKSLLKRSEVAKRARKDLKYELYDDLSDLYEAQLALLKQACLDQFKADQRGVRITANLPNDVEELVNNSIKKFTEGAKKLRAGGEASGWPSADGVASQLRRELKESSTRLLQMARLSGKFRPVPRKGITLGFHWLLPKPFGNDYRQEPWTVTSQSNLIYTPPDKITDASKGEVTTGDWRRGVVPNPSAAEMVYMGGN